MSRLSNEYTSVYTYIYICVYLSVDVRMFMPRCYRNWQPDKENKTVTYKLTQCQVGKKATFYIRTRSTFI